MTEPKITSIRYSSGPARRTPKPGDLRETKKHGRQVRVRERVEHGPYSGALISRNGRPAYEWVGFDEARRRGLGHFLPKEGDAAA